MNKNIISLTAIALVTGSLGFVFPMSALASPDNEQPIGRGMEAERSLAEQGTEAVQEILQLVAGSSEMEAMARQDLVDYALQFVGCRYRAGGNDPHTGADCSGFVKYVMQHGAGITLNRSSASQATQGVAVSAEEMQQGDLLFYSNGSGINHVAMYIGAGQVVHASTYNTGITISPWNYRAPAKIVNMME